MGAQAPVRAPMGQYHGAALVTLRFHADQDFTPRERLLLDQAVTKLAYQTAGYLDVRIVFDLSMADVEELTKGMVLLRVPDDSDWASVLDVKLGRILGLTIQKEDMPPSVFLLADRLKDDARFVHTAMHEFFHAAGVPHTPDEAGLMYASVTTPMMSCLANGGTPYGCVVKSNQVTLCVNESDAMAFCILHKCHISALNYCRDSDT